MLTDPPPLGAFNIHVTPAPCLQTAVGCHPFPSLLRSWTSISNKLETQSIYFFSSPSSYLLGCLLFPYQTPFECRKVLVLLTLFWDQDPRDRVLRSSHGMKSEASISQEALACKPQR